MSVAGLLRWQWDGYPRYHRSRANLLVHIVAVPLFVLGNVGLIVTLLRGASNSGSRFPGSSCPGDGLALSGPDPMQTIFPILLNHVARGAIGAR